jgi:hypothetical protein
MTGVQDVQTQLRAINQSAAFNRWCGLEVKSASAGQVELVMPWRPEFGQYSVLPLALADEAQAHGTAGTAVGRGGTTRSSHRPARNVLRSVLIRTSLGS